MISFAKDKQKQTIISIWQTSFPEDSQEFVDMYFADKYKTENTLVYMQDNTLVSCLQMLPYNMLYYNQICCLSYISGASTLPYYQNKGIMGKLLSQSFLEMKNRGDVFSILIPQEHWLIAFYQKYGYIHCFEHFSTPAYDCTDCFLDIFAFLELDNMPVNEVMVRVLDVEKALRIYASFNTDLQVAIKVNDSQIAENNGIFYIHNGHCCRKQDTYFDIETNVDLLTQQIFSKIIR